MIRFRTWLCAASAALGLTLGLGVHAQSNITIKLPSGASCNFSGSTLDCTGGGVVTPPNPTCQLTASTTQAQIGTNVTLSVGSCTGFNPSGATTSYSWNVPCTNGGGATCVITSTAIANISAGASVSDSAAGAVTVSGSPIVVHFVDQSGSGGGDPGTIPTKCADGKSSITAPAISSFTGIGQTVKFSNSQVAVIPIVVPPGLAKFTIQTTEWGDSTDGTPRNIWLSKTACSNASTTVPFNQTVSEGMVLANRGSVFSLNFFVGPSSNINYTSLGGIDVNVRAGETWYLMIEWNTTIGRRPSGCGASQCQMKYLASALN